ncbi:MAG: FAD-dependent oxidoreductase, partial [Pseudothermotoga sp.]
AMYGGKIHSRGVRYCPSIEDKVVKFPQRDSHTVFLERDGYDTTEIYPSGISNSLPFDVQIKFVRTIPGLERAEIIRPGYAIEYDFCDPTQLYHTLETKIIENLFFAGQITGVEGYLESAASGLYVALNLYRVLNKLDPVVLPRTTMMGALFNYISRGSDHKLQPMYANYGLLSSYKQSREQIARKALEDMKNFLQLMGFMKEDIGESTIKGFE